MFKMIEQYTNNLEDLIKEKTIKLEEEKKKTEKNNIMNIDLLNVRLLLKDKLI